MNRSLEPLPTKQLVAVKANTPKASITVEGSDTIEGSDIKSDRNVYPWLLGASTCLSVALCWMYVTKPVIAAVDYNTTTPSVADTSDVFVLSDELVESEVQLKEDKEDVLPEPDLMPSSETLPGESLVSEQSSPEKSSLQNVFIDPLQLSGWEKTHHKVQHVLQADLGNGNLEKIVIDVPVFYQTRMMHWEVEDVAAARNVLSRLLAYEAELNKLKAEGEATLLEWNQILERTVPVSALRADSPSLPYNHAPRSGEGTLSDSEPVIKVEK